MDSQGRENAENIRNKGMERLGQTQKRKADGFGAATQWTFSDKKKLTGLGNA